MIHISATLAATMRTSGWEGTGLTGLQMLGAFVALPLVAFVVIALLFVLVPQWARGSGSRPGLMWATTPVWFRGPENGQQSVEVAEPSRTGGGASAHW